MKLLQIFFFMFLTVCFSAEIFAQKNDTSEKVKTKEQIELETKAFDLLTEVADETASLKLAENRSLVLSIAADLLWKSDEKRARQLFRNAANELVQLQTAPPNRRQINNENAEYYRNIIFNNLRGQLIYRVLAKDAELASEIFYNTRPPELDNAVQTYQQIIAQTGKAPDLSKYKQDKSDTLGRAANEIQLEQRIKKEIYKNDPQKLAENMREAFAKDNLPYDFLSDLDALNKKDHDLAQKVLSEIMRNLADADFSNYSKWFAAIWLYRRFLEVKNKLPNQTSNDKNKQLEFDEKSIKAIANQEFDYLLSKNPTENDGNYVERVFTLKQILPERFREIKSKFEKAKGLYSEWTDEAETAKKLGDNPTLNQIIENSSKHDVNSKNNYYEKAIDKLSETESEEKIAQMLDQIPDAKDKENALDHLKSISAAKKAKQENAAEAKQAVLQIKSEQEKISRLIALAIFYHQKKNDESQKIAEDLMNEASKSVSENPETQTEFTALLPVISGYATVNPSKAFDLILPIIGKSNELIDAYVLLSNYNDNYYPYVRDNEILLGGQDGYHNYKGRYGEIAKKLAAGNFEESKKLIGNFKRADVRILAKLILIESVLTQ